MLVEQVVASSTKVYTVSLLDSLIQDQARVKRKLRPTNAFKLYSQLLLLLGNMPTMVFNILCAEPLEG